MADAVTLFLCGDVMTGRGIDQILPSPNEPQIFESWVRDAREYVSLAEAANGPIRRPVTPSYIWGDALAELSRVAPAARIVNLETSVTRSSTYERGKGINYRMHPDNVGCLVAAGVDVCVLANNHVMDYGLAGLRDTLSALAAAGVMTAGAGATRVEAERPAIVPVSANCRIVVFGFGTGTSGIPPWWGAGDQRAGMNLLDDLGQATMDKIASDVRSVKRAGDIVVASIHWGGNWGYDVPHGHVNFARGLVESGVDIVHGHSSHHPMPIEIYNDRLVLYGCGDFINDYEGIEGHEQYRGDLALMYFPAVSADTGQLVSLDAVPMQIRNMRLNHPSSLDTELVRATLDRISTPYGVHADAGPGGTLIFRWRRSGGGQARPATGSTIAAKLP
jgi:poly-gamma-glutamate synthesis protein (capsule biosynthesis protein)